MEIIDAQLHTSREHPPEQLLSMMDAVGVAAAVLVHASRDGNDISAVLDAAATHPDRFAAVGAVDSHEPDLDDRVEELRTRPETVGLRLVIPDAAAAQRLRDGFHRPLFVAAERAGLPLFIFALHAFDAIGAIAREHADLLVVIDHLGLPQPPLREPDPERWQGLPDLVALAACANVAVKWTAVPTLSLRPYPYDDLWDPLRRVLDAFGVERVMWGTDITRVGGLHTYCDSVSYMKRVPGLTYGELELLMGGTLRRLLDWRPTPQARP